MYFDRRREPWTSEEIYQVKQLEGWVDASHLWKRIDGYGSHRCEWCDAFFNEGYQSNQNICPQNPKILEFLSKSKDAQKED